MLGEVAIIIRSPKLARKVYSPELNPDELVWKNNVKNHVVGRKIIRGSLGTQARGSVLNFV